MMSDAIVPIPTMSLSSSAPITMPDSFLTCTSSRLSPGRRKLWNAFALESPKGADNSAMYCPVSRSVLYRGLHGEG
ncbi:unnamed protein product [Periconia digitata]|uniref:Uncharacterized protein n=1 Tax=Periconia digitata TaxID=1303443 RepID=A0A9W4U577_9PLEO|nr:unnamed protein product [Periconia digitata]